MSSELEHVEVKIIQNISLLIFYFALFIDFSSHNGLFSHFLRHRSQLVNETVTPHPMKKKTTNLVYTIIIYYTRH